MRRYWDWLWHDWRYWLCWRLLVLLLLRLGSAAGSGGAVLVLSRITDMDKGQDHEGNTDEEDSFGD